MGLAINLDERGPGWILTLVGDVEYGSLHDLNELVTRVIAAKPPYLIADLSGVGYIDSSGVGMLVLLLEQYAGVGQRLVFIVSDGVDLLLSMSGLLPVLCIVPDMQTALEVVEPRLT